MTDPLIVGWAHTKFGKAEAPDTMALMAEVALPPELEAFNTYRQAGLVPWPICTPTAASIDAALAPDTADKYIYFLAIPDGDGAHAFAKTAAEHRENREKYGYN